MGSMGEGSLLDPRPPGPGRALHRVVVGALLTVGTSVAGGPRRPEGLKLLEPGALRGSHAPRSPVAGGTGR